MKIKENKKYYILMLIMVIISITIPVCANANEFSQEEWNSSVAAEQSKFQSSALAEQSRRQREWDSSVAQEQAKWDSSVAQKNAEWSSSVAAEQSQRDAEQSRVDAAKEQSMKAEMESINSRIAQSREEQNKIENEVEERKKGFQKVQSFVSLIVAIFVVLFIAGAAFEITIIVKAVKGNRSAKTTFVPFQPVSSDNENHTPQNTLQKVEGKCMYCGKDISSDSEFCNHCGKKQVEEYVKVFNRYHMNNDEFIASINSWLASNPKIANVKCEFNMRTGYGFLVNKYLLDSVALKYELFKNNNENQYAIVELKKFGFYQKSSDALLEEWKANNPNAVVLKRSGGRHSRGEEGHELFLGIGANNNTQLFIFFKFKRNQ